MINYYQYYYYRNSRIFVVKNFRFAQKDENFLRENCLLVILYTVNVWCAFDMNENIVTRKFLTQYFANKINVNYGICPCSDRRFITNFN